MAEEAEVIIDPINEEVEEDTEEVEETTEETPEEKAEETPIEEKPTETPEAKAARLLRQANQARKKLGLPPLGEVKPAEKVEKAENPNSLSTKDAIALMTAKVTEDEDIDEVQNYADFKGITIAEALKTSVVKTLLEERADERKAAEAASTTTRSRSTTKPSGGSEFLSRARKSGELPDGDDALENLAKARMEERKNKTK